MIEHVYSKLGTFILIAGGVSLVLLLIMCLALFVPALIDESKNAKLRVILSPLARVVALLAFFSAIGFFVFLPASTSLAAAEKQKAIFEEHFDVETPNAEDWVPVVTSFGEIEFSMTIALPSGEEYKTVLKSIPSEVGKMTSIYLVTASNASTDMELFTVENLIAKAKNTSTHEESLEDLTSSLED